MLDAQYKSRQDQLFENNHACGSFVRIIRNIYRTVVSMTEGKDIGDLPLEPGKHLSQVW